MMNDFALIALKGTVVLVAAVGLDFVLRRAAASTRHAVWLLALASLTWLGVGALALPPWPVPLLLAESVASQEASLAVVSDPPAAAVIAPQTIGSSAPAATSVERTQATPSPPITRVNWYLMAWLTGTLLAFLPWLSSRLAAMRLLRRAEPAPDDWADLVHELCERTRLPRAPTVVLVDAMVSPMTFGWRDAHVILPGNAVDWSRERLRAVLLHELAHVKRRDDLTHAMARLGCMLHWFNPLAWFALRRLRYERELACDDLVIRAGLPPVDYAATLIALAHSLRARCGLPAMAESSTIERRVRAALDASRRRSPLGRRSLVLLTSSATLALALLAAARPIPATSTLADDIRDRIAAARKLALHDLHHVHFVVSGQEWDWNEATQQWQKSQARWHARVWYEGGETARFRVDYDPAIRHWRSGPFAPTTSFSVTRSSESWDGNLYRRLDHRFRENDASYTSQLSHSQPDYPKYVPFEGLDRGAFDQNGEQVHGKRLSMPHDIGTFPVDQLQSLEGITFDVRENQQGMIVLELTVSRNQIQRYVLDPEKNYATVSEERTGSIRSNGYTLWQATAWKQLSANLWMPTSWEAESRYPDRNQRQTVTVESAGYFSPRDADAIFSMQDIDTTTRSPDPPAGPSFTDLDGPP